MRAAFSFKVDLIHINSIPGNDTVSYGMDLSEYYLNVEWDILSVPSERHVKSYPCCPEQYPGKITQPISKEFAMEQKVEFLTQCEILTLVMYLLCITMHCCSILHCPYRVYQTYLDTLYYKYCIRSKKVTCFIYGNIGK